MEEYTAASHPWQQASSSLGQLDMEMLQNVTWRAQKLNISEEI